MEQIALADTGRNTTRLGFGCSSLMGAMGRRASLRLLESAYDAGIRHFDVAPMYGYGEAESCLGDFLKRHSDRVTVTTKYGIPPAKKSSIISLARHIAGPIVRSLPGLKRRLAQTANAVTRKPERAAFTPEQAKASLERSLLALGTDHIDLWLLHEASASDLQDDALLTLLQDKRQDGMIGAFGAGSSADKIPALLTQHPAYCQVLQYEWSVLDPSVETASTAQASPFRIHHRALTENFRSLHAYLILNKQICQRWSTLTNTDLSEPEDLAHLMLKASLVLNPRSIILFSSKNPHHIEANVKIAEDPKLEAPAREFYRLVHADHDQPSAGQAGAS